MKKELDLLLGEKHKNFPDMLIFIYLFIIFLPSNENGNKYFLLGLSANLNTACDCFLISSLTKAK